MMKEFRLSSVIGRRFYQVPIHGTVVDFAFVCSNLTPIFDDETGSRLFFVQFIAIELPRPQPVGGQSSKPRGRAQILLCMKPWPPIRFRLKPYKRPHDLPISHFGTVS